MVSVQIPGPEKKPATGWKKVALALGSLVFLGLVVAIPTAVVWVTIWALGEVFN